MMMFIIVFMIVTITLHGCASNKKTQKTSQTQKATLKPDNKDQPTQATLLTEKELENLKVHIVEQGESLSIIAKKYGVSLEDIIKLNNIENPDLIVVGQKLYIPE